MSIKKIITNKAPSPIGPYSQAIQVDGRILYTAGQIPIDPENGKLIEGDIKAQTRQVMKNLDAILKEGGSSLNSVVKTTVFLKEMSEFPAMNEVYAEYLGAASPARSTVEVARLPRDVRIEIEVIALVEPEHPN